MNNQDFAELKRVLTEFHSYEVKKYILNYVDMGGFSKPAEALPYLTDGALIAAAHQHTKSSAIISELIEIIKSQSEALERYAFRTQSHAVSTVVARNSIDNTNTRLQKLMEGNK